MKKKIKINPVFAILSLIALVVFVAFADGSSVYQLAAFAPCLGVLDGNLDVDCDNPRVAGYEDTALIFNRSDIDWSSVTYDTSNKRIVKTLAVLEGKKPYVIYSPQVNPAPFDGTQTAFNQDGDSYDKTVQFIYKGIGAAASKNVVEPLKSGSYIVLLQRKDHAGDGSFQLIGFQAGVRATAQVQDEATGYWLMTMTGQESYAETSFFNTDYETTKTAFDALLAQV